MLKLSRALFCALLVLATLGPISGGKFGGGRSGGYSRGGGHSYPSSHSGLSGSGSRHSGGLSGGGHGYSSSSGSHAYPSGGLSGSGGSHGYPSSGGSHGSPSSGGSHGYPSGGLSGGNQGSGKHTYPSGSGLSGGHSQSHNYPNRGVAGNTHTSHTTINHNYNYAPPKQISYSAPGQRAVSYPVYHGTPPTYVYQYKNSGSKYGTLLAGLALLNLGALAGTAYAVSQSHNSHSQSSYKPQPGEYCKFGVKKDNGDYEETKIDCQLITSFIFQESAKAPAAGGTNTTVVTVTNVTVVNTTNGVEQTTTAPNVFYQMLSNGTLVPVNVTLPNADNTTNVAPNGTLTSSMTVTTTTTNTTVTNALDVKGKEIQVTPGMQCFVMRHSPTSNMRKSVPCGLLQSYADQSIKKNSAARNIPAFTIMCAVVAFVFH